VTVNATADSKVPGAPAVPLCDPYVFGLFRKFPLALALIDAGVAAPRLNAAFERLLDPRCLQQEPLLGLSRSADPNWRIARLAGRDGTSISARAQSLPVQDSVMLVIDWMAEDTGAVRIEELRARIAELERVSATDRLTGAWNRTHLDRMVETELGRSLRSREPVSLVLLDIDHFKRINDTHGHQVGDDVLRELVRVMQSNIRQADLLFRWGGEEFVVLASATGYRGAAALAESLRSAVQAHAFPLVGGITVSAGVAEHLATEGAAEWFGRVDAALYAAKEGGRNRVSTDRRGSSDLWAGEGGKSALHLDWLEAYECGDEVIDREHRELFEIANRVIAASLNGTLAALMPVLDELIAHVAQHFRDEEALLEQRGYVKLEAHARAHAGLLARAAELRRAAAAGEASFGAVVEFLAGEVVARHLFTADRDFFPLFAP